MARLGCLTGQTSHLFLWVGDHTGSARPTGAGFEPNKETEELLELESFLLSFPAPNAPNTGVLAVLASVSLIPPFPVPNAPNTGAGSFLIPFSVLPNENEGFAGAAPE